MPSSRRTGSNRSGSSRQETSFSESALATSTEPKGKNAVNGKQKNQHPPTPPDADIKNMLQVCLALGLSDARTAKYVLARVGPGFSMSGKSVQRARKRFELEKTVMQKHTIETVLPTIMEIKDEFPQMGARSLTQALRVDHGIAIPEPAVLAILHQIEPQAVESRKHRQFIKRVFRCEGVNEFWCMDQHDKMQKYGLRYHACVEPMSGKCLWLRVWWTNSNPRIVLKYYLDLVRELGYIPSYTMSDKGNENNLVANIQTLIRQQLDGSLDDTLLHRWMLKHGNIKPEIFWSGFRRTWSPGFEALFDKGGFDQEGLCCPSDSIDQMVFRYLAIPWLQTKLDAHRRKFNMTPRRADKAKELPQDIPDLIFNEPITYAGNDLKIDIPTLEMLNQFEEKWVPEGHTVLDLVPPDFKGPADLVFFERMRGPRITMKTFWQVFKVMRRKLDRELNSLPPTFRGQMGSALEEDQHLHTELVVLLDGYKRLRRRPDPIAPAGEETAMQVDVESEVNGGPTGTEDGGVEGTSYSDWDPDDDEEAGEFDFEEEEPMLEVLLTENEDEGALDSIDE